LTVLTLTFGLTFVTIAYEFTASSYSATEMRDKITFIIKKAFTMGITIKAVVSDMRPQNRSVWRLFGITAGKYSQIKNYTPHPCDELSNQKLYISPDPVHIFKNICGALTDGNIFELEESIVRQYNLPFNSVSIQPVQKVCDG
jgi:hypothetical protein